MNLKLLTSWLGWKTGHEKCHVFEKIPDNITLNGINHTPYTILEYQNKCPYPVRVQRVDNQPTKLRLGSPVWVDANSVYHDMINCVDAEVGQYAVLEDDTGESATFTSNCVSYPIGTDTAQSTDFPGNKLAPIYRYDPSVQSIIVSWFQYPSRQIYNADYELSECCKKCSKALWHSFCTFFDTLGVKVKHEGLYQRFCGGCPVEGQTCSKHQWMNFCEFYDSFNIPFMAEEHKSLCRSDCAFTDIRDNPDYYNFTFRDYVSEDYGWEQVSTEDFLFALLTAGEHYASQSLLFAQVPFVVPIQLDNPDPTTTMASIPNQDIPFFLAPLWAKFSGLGEAGAVRTADLVTVQWTDLEMPGGGKVSAQMAMDNNGNWRVRTGRCSGDTSFLSTAVVGWQTDELNDQIEICDPCNIALDFNFHRQTRYVMQDVPPLVTFPVTYLDDWVDDELVFDYVLHGGTGQQPAPQGEIRYFINGENTPARATVISYYGE